MCVRFVCIIFSDICISVHVHYYVGIQYDTQCLIILWIHNMVLHFFTEPTPFRATPHYQHAHTRTHQDQSSLPRLCLCVCCVVIAHLHPFVVVFVVYEGTSGIYFMAVRGKKKKPESERIFKSHSN